VLPTITKTTGRQPAGEAVTGAALSTRSCRVLTNVGVHTCAETYQQHGRMAGGKAGYLFKELKAVRHNACAAFFVWAKWQ